MSDAGSSLLELCGNLVVGGFEGRALPASYARALAEGRRAGAILFSRNMPDVSAAFELCTAIADASPSSPLIGIDQEGGRVARLEEPVLRLPAMRHLAALAMTGGATEPQAARTMRIAGRALGRQLAAIGFNIDFAPVLDVDSNPNNPVIGDRALSRSPEVVAALGVAFADGLREGGVHPCGKHFPGHGDTDVDSHVGLPVVRHDEARLRAVEWPPFAAAARAGMAAIMTAHVVCDALDPGVPATLSRRLCTEVLRGELGFGGALISDDLEMQAIAASMPIGDAATRAVEAGCDILLVCRSEALQDEALAALAERAARDAGFRARCEDAAARSRALRRTFVPSPSRDRFDDALVHSDALETAQRVERAPRAVGPTVGER